MNYDWIATKEDTLTGFSVFDSNRKLVAAVSSYLNLGAWQWKVMDTAGGPAYSGTCSSPDEARKEVEKYLERKYPAVPAETKPEQTPPQQITFIVTDSFGIAHRVICNGYKLTANLANFYASDELGPSSLVASFNNYATIVRFSVESPKMKSGEAGKEK